MECSFKSIHVINEANSAVNLHVLPEDTLQTVKKQHRIGFFSWKSLAKSAEILGFEKESIDNQEVEVRICSHILLLVGLRGVACFLGNCDLQFQDYLLKSGSGMIHITHFVRVVYNVINTQFKRRITKWCNYHVIKWNLWCCIDMLLYLLHAFASWSLCCKTNLIRQLFFIPNWWYSCLN